MANREIMKHEYSDEIEVSVVMPCLNEEKTIGSCIRKVISTLNRLGIDGEVVISDNGSNDRSNEIAQSLGARVVHQSLKGYGHALMKGFEEARGKYIIMGDADDSYDFTDLERFILRLRAGADLVMGDRLKGKIMPGAMPWKNRYIGNPVLSGILNLIFHPGVSDCHCGMRAFRKDILPMMQLQCAGMEFASEMVIKAAKFKLKIESIPITLYKDGRNRPPHLRPWRDGWRHSKFMLLYSPIHLFLLPGAAMLSLGLFLLAFLALKSGPVFIGPLRFDTHWAVLGSLVTLLGYQIINIGVFARIYSITHRLVERDNLIEAGFKFIRLETGLIFGLLLFLLGFAIDLYVLVKWIGLNMGPLDEFRTSLLGSTLMILGVQTIFNALFLSILGDAYKRRKVTEERVESRFQVATTGR